jgi:hypothetical protein
MGRGWRGFYAGYLRGAANPWLRGTVVFLVNAD